MKILDENYFDLIMNNVLLPLYDIDGSINDADSVTYINERHSIIHLPATDNICALGSMPYHIFPSLYEATSPISMRASGIQTLQDNPYLDLRGQGVLVGVIDTGIDYTHPAFRNPDNSTRLVSIWDQTEQSGSPPKDFTFGTEYKAETINKALSSETPESVVPISDSGGHGTSVASIIAGSPSITANFSGVVPKAELVIVKLKEAKRNIKNIFCVPNDVICYMESDIMLGVSYVYSVAQSLQRPVVICIALGSSQGGHDGHGALSSYLDSLSQLPWTGVSISAGNEGIAGRHYFGTAGTAPFQDDVELLAGAGDTEFALEIWSSYSRLSIEILAPNHESTQQIFPSILDCRRLQFIFHECEIWINNIIFEQETGDQLILIRFKKMLPGIWTIRIRNLENEAFSFHAWQPAGSMLTNNTYFLKSDPDTTITSPGNSYHSLTVTAYDQRVGKIIQASGRGYTRNGHIKPDLAAPGYRVPCALPQNRYGNTTGSGAASAFAAGAIAMILEWSVARGNYTSITGNDINRLLTRGARHNQDIFYPNNVWGFGELEVNKVFEQLAMF